MAKTTTGQKKKRKIPIPVKCLLVLFAMLFVASLIFYIYMKGQTRPDRLAENYVDAFMSKDTSALFDMIGFEVSPFITADSFARSLEECHSYSSITSYSIVQYPPDSDDRRQFGLQFWDDHHNCPYAQTLILNLSESKQYLLFDNWTIDTAEYLAKSCTLDVPAGSTVTVDDVELTENMQGSSNEYSITYQLGDLFAGPHSIRVQLAGFDDFTTQVFLNSADYSSKPIYTITGSMLKVSHSAEKTLKEQTHSFIQALYDNLLSEKSFGELARDIPFEESGREALEQAYNSLMSANILSATHLTGVEFSAVSSSISNTYAEDHCYAVNITSSVDYTATSEVLTGTSSDSVPRSTSGHSLFTTTLHYKNGTWSIYSSTAFDTCVYYARS